MNLIEAFEKGKVEGFDKPADKIIKSAISKIYFYGDKVCKVYEYDRFFFGDFGSFDFRKDFYQKDFHWNKIMAPDIYLSLRGVERAGQGYRAANPEVAEDFYIEMKKVDAEKNLSNLLLSRKIKEDDLKEIVGQMTKRSRELIGNQRENLRFLFRRSCLSLLKENLEDLRNWVYLSEPKITKEKADKMTSVLQKALRQENYFVNFNPADLGLMLDNHSDNIILFSGKAEFIDTMPPKESWRVGDPYFNICRPAVDTAVLWSEEKAEIMYDTYAQLTRQIVPLRVKIIHQIRSSIIRAPYFYLLNKSDLAEKYMEFAERKLSLL